MNALQVLCEQAAILPEYRVLRSHAATEAALKSCEEAIGSRLPRSLRECLQTSDGFDIWDSQVSLVRVYSVSEIVSATIEARTFWLYSDGTSPWGDFIEIARSDHTESAYAVRPLDGGIDESPLYELWPEGYATWQTDPPLAPTFGQWLVTIAKAMLTEDRQRVFDTLWPGQTKRA
jgi:hypothetical protein